MSLWGVVLLAAALGFAAKLAGYLVPPTIIEGRRRSNVVTLLPVALLAGLIITQTMSGADGGVTVDARLAAVVVAVVLLVLRANFLVVVFAAAAVAAGLRALGWG